MDLTRTDTRTRPGHIPQPLLKRLQLLIEHIIQVPLTWAEIYPLVIQITRYRAATEPATGYIRAATAATKFPLGCSLPGLYRRALGSGSGSGSVAA